MNPVAHDQQVVLRDTLFMAVAVRLPRGPGAAAASDLAGSQVMEAQPHEDPRIAMQAAAHAEGLRQGQEEGQRIGYEEGLRRGIAVGQDEARAAADAAAHAAQDRVEEKCQRLDALLCALGDGAREAWAGAEDDVLALCYETLCRVFAEAAGTPEAIRLQVVGLLASCDLQGAVTLLLHPADVRLLDEAREQGQLPGAGGRPLHWRGDPSVALGGCIVTGAGGG
ncbi:MAG: flagellar assembly protein FliH, partial [Ramlibacter sp.]